MKQTVRFLSLALLLTLSGMAIGRPLPIPEPPSLNATSYILIDAESGQILAASNPNKPVEPASITKLMTVYIAFDAISQGTMSLDDKVLISKKAWKMKGSSMFVEVGDKVSVKLLLHGIITDSGNDATVALAEHIAGTEDAFAGYMNQYAKRLGLQNSHFVNSSGWPAKGHQMSAHDMARVLQAIIQDFPKLYKEFFHQLELTYNGITQYNRNSLLWTDDRVDGGKTGHTQAAGYCLVASGIDDGMRLISVVTGTPSENARISQSEALLNYGFRFFKTGKLYDDGEAITSLRVWKGDSDKLPVVAKGPVHITYPRGRRDQLTTTAELPKTLVAPIQKGQRLGTLNIKYGERVLLSVPLYAGKEIKKGGFIGNLMDDVMMMFQ